MTIKFYSFIIIIAVCGLSACRMHKESMPAVFSKLNQEIKQNSAAYENLKYATETIGHRLTGTENGRKAEEYTYKLFREYNLKNVRFQEFEVEAWMRKSVALEIVPANSDNFVQVPAVTLAHSPLDVNMEAALVDLGNGLAADFEKVGRDNIKGKIVICNVGIDPPNSSLQNLHRSEKTALAIHYGASGIVIINQVPGNVLLTGTASVDGSLIPIPAVSVSLESGRQIRKWMAEETLQAHIQMTNTSNKIKARNVIAQIRGTESPNEKIVIGGHLDSWDLATGAIDNGIGSFTVIEIARAMRELKLKPKRTIEFVMFMGEEVGLLGSAAMVEQLKQKNELSKVKYMINLDMTGNAVGFNAMGRPDAKAFFEDIGKIIAEVDSTYPNKVTSNPGLHSDHQTFMLEGIPVAAPISNMDPKVYSCYHASCDGIELVNPQDMVNTARYTAMLLYALAEAEKLPTQQLSDEETKQFLIRHNLMEKLKIGGDWRWKD
jgi:carboxypeptidase Q